MGTIPQRHSFNWLPLNRFLPKVPAAYTNKTKELLAKIESNVEYIGSTNDFFVLNATQKGKPAFIAIEAPGEDYFVRSSGELFAPLYLSSLVELPQPKVYVFVFSHDILNGEDAYIRAYDAAVAAFIAGGLKRGRDRFLLLYSKVKTDPDLQTGITESQSAARAFGAGGISSRTGAAFRNSPVKDAKIIPYWSGTFKLDTTVGKETRTWPDPEYPAALTEALIMLLRGSPWWRFWA